MDDRIVPDDRTLIVIAIIFRLSVDRAYRSPLVRACMRASAKLCGNSVNRPR